MSGKTGLINALGTPPGDAPSADGDASGNDDGLVFEQKNFGIRMADTENGRNSASMLINKMYAWRGYGSGHQLKANPARITLTASDKEKRVIGTVSLGMDSDEGLLADEIFRDQIDARRNAGGKVCELTKLAFDPDTRSRFALASLFHIVFIHGRRMHGCTDVFIEVNPRHRRFYETMLGFRRLCEVRMNPRVNAPAVLLWVDIAYVEEQIQKYGGTSDNPDTTRSLYPYFFSPREEAGILGRLVAMG
ncbi:MAG: N-acetyltransferase [Noviherbaspirillum sp.]